MTNVNKAANKSFCS